MRSKLENLTNLVSVVVTTRNRAHLLPQALDSILALRHDHFDLEIVVVDDGSTDDTPAVVASYPAQYIRRESVGIAGARNAGLESVTGDFVAFLDDDDVFLPDAIENELRLLQDHPDYGAVQGQAMICEMDFSHAGQSFPAAPLTSGWIHHDLLGYCPQIGTQLARIDAARGVGLFDTTLKAVDEWDWMLRIAKRYPIGRLEQPVMLFRQRGKAEEELLWERCPSAFVVWRRHVRELPLFERVRLVPVGLRHRGFYAGVFLWYAGENWSCGERKRALRAVYYATRCSPAHALVGLLRRCRH